MFKFAQNKTKKKDTRNGIPVWSGENSNNIYVYRKTTISNKLKKKSKRILWKLPAW